MVGSIGKRSEWSRLICVPIFNANFHSLKCSGLFQIIQTDKVDEGTANGEDQGSQEPNYVDDRGRVAVEIQERDDVYEQVLDIADEQDGGKGDIEITSPTSCVAFFSVLLLMTIVG
jgi:hypothetical protein